MKRKSLFYLLIVLLFGTQAVKAQLEKSKLVITDGLRNETLKALIAQYLREKHQR
jgi:hypothetical protein